MVFISTAPDTATGRSEPTVVPLPSCPLSFAPQQNAPPSRVTAQAWRSPAVTWMASGVAGDAGTRTTRGLPPPARSPLQAVSGTTASKARILGARMDAPLSDDDFFQS